MWLLLLCESKEKFLDLRSKDMCDRVQALRLGLLNFICKLITEANIY